MIRLPNRWPLLVVLLTIGLLVAACGEAGDDTGDQAGAEAEPEDAEEPADDEEAEPVELTIVENAVRGGKNATTAEWLLEDVIPAFEEQMEAEGRQVTVEFQETGIEDEDYKTQLALDLSAGEGADIIGFDQFWVSEFDAAGYLAPLDEIAGPEVNEWEGWDAIPDAVAGSLELDGSRYGIPFGTDGRVLYYRQDIFEDAGLDTDWQPTSWEEILDTARQLADHDPDLVPLQINAGTPMGEATTMQGLYPVLLGTGAELYDDGWLGDNPELREAVEFYQTIYVDEELGDAQLQLRSDARDRSFEMFSNGEIAILAEGDWFWRAVVEPEEGLFPIENRDEVVGWALMPAREPGAGIRGQDYVSASGGTGRVLNPNTEHPQEAWEFLAYTGSEEAIGAFVEREPRITAREDVNEFAVEDDPLLTFIAEEVLPITWYRPGFEEYTQVSEELQLVTENVVSGRESVDEAVQRYGQSLESVVGAENVR